MERARQWLSVALGVLAVLLVAGGVYVATTGVSDSPRTAAPDGAGSQPASKDRDRSGDETNQVPVAGYDVVGPRVVRLHYYIGVPACYGRVEGIDVSESAARVSVLLIRMPPRDISSVACIDIALARTATVTLEEPLGDRRVVDVTTGTEVPEGHPADSPGTG
jgi:hypothetical protein